MASKIELIGIGVAIFIVVMALYGAWRLIYALAAYVHFRRLPVLDEAEVKAQVCETYGLCRRVAHSPRKP